MRRDDGVGPVGNAERQKTLIATVAAGTSEDIPADILRGESGVV